MDLDLALVADRIRETVTDFRLVGGAAAFMAARGSLKQAPAAFVVPISDKAGRNQVDTAISQTVATRFGVFIAVQSLRDLSGEQAQAELGPLRRAVRDSALLGWTPDANVFQPILYAGGRLTEMDLGDRVIWWQDDYDTDYLVRKP